MLVGSLTLTPERLYRACLPCSEKFAFPCEPQSYSKHGDVDDGGRSRSEGRHVRDCRIMQGSPHSWIKLRAAQPKKPSLTQGGTQRRGARARRQVHSRGAPPGLNQGAWDGVMRRLARRSEYASSWKNGCEQASIHEVRPRRSGKGAGWVAHPAPLNGFTEHVSRAQKSLHFFVQAPE